MNRNKILSKYCWEKSGFRRLSSFGVFVVTSLQWGAFSPILEAQIPIPKQEEWVDYGIIFEAGEEGEWDHLLWGGFTNTVIKREGTYYLYYQGATSYRVEPDETVEWRAIGVATSQDGVNFTKYISNPVVTWFPSGYPDGNGEEGAASGGVTLDANGDFALYYGANTSASPTTVHADTRLALSEDGFSFTDVGVVLNYTDGSIWGAGDELFPIAAIHDAGQWIVYYLPNGSGVGRSLGVAWGDSRDNLNNSAAARNGLSTIGAWGTAGKGKVGPETYAIFTNWVTDPRIEVRLMTLDAPDDLSDPVEVYQFADLSQATVLLDEQSQTWFMYYRNSDATAYGVKLAPVGPGDTTPPAAPTGLTATAISSSQINLSWTDNSMNESGFKIERSLSPSSGFLEIAAVGMNVTAYADSGLADTTNYYYRVGAYNSTGTSGYSNTAGATTEGNSSLSAPFDLQVMVQSTSQVNLTWNDSNRGIKGFQVERSEAASGPFVEIGTTKRRTRFYSDSGLSAGTAYYYRVRAYKRNDLSNPSNVAIAVTEGGAPLLPTDLTATATACNEIELTWNASSDATGYRLYRNVSYVTQVSGTSYTDSGLAASTVYSYRLSSVGEAGNVSALSSASSTNTPACAKESPVVTINDAGGGGGSHSWLMSFGDVTNDRGQSVATDSQGNTIVTGSFRGTTDFGGGSVTSSAHASLGPSYDVFVAKYSPSGDYLWSKVFGNAATDEGLAVATDQDDSIVVAGNFELCVKFGGDLLWAVGSDIFVAKYAPDGTHLWSFNIGVDGLGSEEVADIAFDNEGNVLVAGTFGDTVDFGGNVLTAIGGTDIFIAKYSSTGAHLWSKQLSSTSAEDVGGMTVDNSGNVILIGKFFGTLNLGRGSLSSAGGADLFLAKYAPAGGNLWAKRFGTSASDGTLLSVATDGSRNILVTGQFFGSVNFGGGPLTSAGLGDIVLAKYSSSGSHIWSRRFGGTSQDSAMSVALDGAGDVLLTGSFSATVDFGGGEMTALNADAFMAQYSSSGNHLWSGQFGSPDNQMGNDITSSADGSILMTGDYSNQIDFGGETITSAGGMDAFLVQLLP